MAAKIEKVYDVERDGVLIASNLTLGDATQLRFEQRNLQPATEYVYRVRAREDGFVGAWSDPLIVRTQNLKEVVPGLAIWTRAERIDKSVNDPVERWQNLTANMGDAMQPTTAAKPTLLRGNIGTKANRKFLRFDGDDTLIFPAKALPATGCSFYAVMRVFGTSTFYAPHARTNFFLFEQQAESATRIGGAIVINGTTDLRTDYAPVPLSEWSLYKVIWNGQQIIQTRRTTTDVFVSSATKANAAFTWNSDFVLGALTVCDMAEVIFDPKPHTAIQQAQIDNYLKEDYGFR